MPVVPRPDFGEGGSQDLGRPVLPFNARERNGEEEGIILQVKVLSQDPAEVVRVAGVLQEALAGIRYNDKRIAVVFTGDDIDMSRGDIEALATAVLPAIARRLGVPMIASMGASR